MKTKIDKRDTVFSLLIRCRANYTCERCEKYCGENGDGGALQCSHIFSRRHVGLRWNPDNAKAMCFTCHKWWHENPTESGVWIRRFLGEGFIDLLTERKNQITKYTKADREDIYNHLKSEYKRIKEIRDSGEGDRIEFVAYD